MIDAVKIESNLDALKRRIADAAARAGRDAEDVCLVAVTKTVTIEEVNVLYDLGVRHFGENRIHVAQPKLEAFTHQDAVWHMIGSVQRRKARDVVAMFDRLDSVDRYELAETLSRRAGRRDVTLPILLEVNVSGEEVKHGFAPEELPGALDRIRELPQIRVEGLMTMAPFVDDPELTRPVFAGLRELAGRLDLTELSMGMTNDFEVAVEEGATQVRVGSALFA